MSSDLKDILSNTNKDIDNQQLMDYLSSHLSQTKQHDVEKAMTDDVFMNDAVEGLQQIEDKKNIQDYVEHLNKELHKQVAKNKKRKEKRRLKDSLNTYLVILILLVLLVIKLESKKEPDKPDGLCGHAQAVFCGSTQRQ